MAVEDKQMSYRIYLVAFGIFLMAMAVVFKLSRIQWVEGEHYRKLAKDPLLCIFVTYLAD